MLLRGAEETGIPLSSYCSVARGEVFKHPVFAEIGTGYGKSAAQVVLRWILQKGRFAQHHVDQAREHPRELRDDGFHPVAPSTWRGSTR